ncbi:MAG: bifunctional acetate--CoA ligase family protein/GNAT family N-acetyltransferase [Thermoleophilia bacterium]|nr:bifunctional acetate--CoA ligase family protein/GNAT family N-acetyltransferase [Thermoleophilia bacterium]
MTIRNLDHLFKPRSIALVGASRQQGSVGARIAQNLFRNGFDGPIMPVNPKYRAVEGVLTYPDVASLPVTPDLAIIATPPATVPGLIAELGARGTRAAVVITAGLGQEAEAQDETLRQAMLDAARPHLLRVLGPNCLGLLVPGMGLNASFAHISPKPGHLAFAAQSGAVVTSVLDWATSRNIGFSHLVSLGDMSDVDFGDVLDYLANDPDTSAILLYIESITNARKFMSAGRVAARMKPVIVVKTGRHPEGARAATSHTGALAGSDEVYDAAFRRAGMLRVLHLEELFDAVQTLATVAPPRGDRLAIVTNGGGAGVMATDALIDEAGHLAELGERTIAALDAALPATWSGANPVDLIGDADAARYATAVRAVRADDQVDGLLVINCPAAVISPSEAAKAVIDVIGDEGQPPVFTSWIGDGSAQEARRLFAERGIATYETPEDAVAAFMQMVSYRRNQLALLETPPSLHEALTPDVAVARGLIDHVLGEGRRWMTEREAKALLAAYEVPVVATHTVSTPAEAAAVAERSAGPVALKIDSPDITHKSDVGGVTLDLVGPEHVEAAAEAMLGRIRRTHPDARLTGFTVQEMVRRPGAFELIIGMTNDAQFGPMLLFGQGGTAVEVVDDKTLAMPPLNMRLARDMMGRTRIFRLLRGYRDRPSVHLDAIAETLMKLSQLVVDFAEIAEVDINPLLADDHGVIALDARVKLMASEVSGTERLAIRPYPKELEESIRLDDGREWLLRPILPEDEPALHAAFAGFAPDELRLGPRAPVQAPRHVVAARFTQLDYDREMTLVLAAPGLPGRSEIFGFAQLSADPDNECAEFTLFVPRDIRGLGAEAMLMERIIGLARRRGIQQVTGELSLEDHALVDVCDSLGFARAANGDDPTTVRLVLRVGGVEPAPR